MKRVLLSLMLVLMSFNLEAQTVYYIVIAEGKVFDQRNKKIEVGDKISRNEKLTFTSKKDFLIGLNAKGTYDITPHYKPTDPELITVLIKDNIRLRADNVVLGSKAMGDEISIQNYFSPTVVNGKAVNDKTLIVDVLKIPVGSMGYAKLDNKENFFFLQLIDTNRNGSNKPLTVKNDTLLLKKEDFMFNGKLYSKNNGILELGFVKGYSTEKKITKIATIKPVFLSTAELSKFVDVVKSAFAYRTKDKLIQQVYSRLYYLYGKPDEQLIEEICRK